MFRMVLRSIYQKPRATIPGTYSSPFFACLGKFNQDTAADQAWAINTTTIYSQKGIRHLGVIMGMLSRHVLGLLLSKDL
jgi:hypothetical protein